ncbi:MAG: YdcH family protein [Pseudomonadota bacterium]
MLTRTKQIAKLERRHRALDQKIEGLQSGRILGDDVATLKREKLKLKDEIMRLRTRTVH